ncbi:MAG: hypothetical protein HY890_01560 [Deltaproteobacteria bacterium]|nr:hypothetical protein [Deltaproteobacteria bacterium]
MLNITIKGLAEAQAAVDDLIKHRIPKMTAIALTAMAKALRDETQKELPRRFEAPTPWTIGGVMYMSASVNKPEAYVWFKDETAVGKGTPAVKYLWPEIHGGPRRLKRYEVALRRFGVLPDGYYTVPGAGARIDLYGNMTQGQITQILTAMGALVGMSDRMFMDRTNRAPRMGGYKRRTGTKNYFLSTPNANRQWAEIGMKMRGGTHLAYGVWERYGSGRSVRPVLLFVKSAPQYKVRFPFYSWAQAWMDREAMKIWNGVVADTLAYWRNKRSAA